MKYFILLFFILITGHWTQNTAKAKDTRVHDLGTHGHTFEIIEPDLLKQIKDKLVILDKNGALSQHNEILTQKAEKAIHTPQSVVGITKAIKSTSFYYDPSITVPYDLKDHEGRIFHKAGTKLNPLKFRSLSSPLIFIDGNDKAQEKWIKRNYLKDLKATFPKIILTSGSPFQLMEQWDQTVYFDQGGRLTGKLGIQHVPAVVTQEGLKLKISEIALEEREK